MVCLGALAASLFHPRPASALELFGLCLVGPCEVDDETDGLIDPKPYDVDVQVVAEGDDGDGLEKSVKDASVLWRERNRPAAGSAGLLTRAQADYKRVLAALYNDARYDATISITLGGQEVANIPAGTELPDNAQLLVSVQAAPRFRFGTAEIQNQAPPPTELFDRVPLPEDEGFAPGEFANATTVKRAGRLAVDAWREQGYAKADVVEQRITAAHTERQLNATLTVEPGRRAVYGPVAVSGTDRMYAPFVARQTGLVPGEEYDPDDLEQADRRLQRLGVFRSVVLKEDDEIGPNGMLPFELTVQERKLHRIGVGATVSTLDGLGVEAYWLHRNLWGRAERLRFDARVSGVGSTDYRDYDYYFGSTLTLPGRFTPDTDVTFNTFAEREVLDLYTKNRVFSSVEAENFFNEEITFSGGLFAGYGEYDDVFGVRRFGIAGVHAGAVYDTRDSELDATRGLFVSLDAKPFYEWEFGNPIGKFEAETRAYLAFGKDEGTVLAGRLKAGTVFGAPIMEIPPDELFLAGGGSSVRGYPYRSIGVNVPGGLAGGRSLIETSAEVRQSVTENIGVVGFVDAGYVGADPVPDFSEDFKVGAGIGLRYDTGLGPIRLDVAIPLNPQSGDPKYGIYAGIGQAF